MTHLLFGIVFTFTIIFVKILDRIIMGTESRLDIRIKVHMTIYFLMLLVYILLDHILFKNMINLTVIIVWVVLSPLFYGIVVKRG